MVFLASIVPLNITFLEHRNTGLKGEKGDIKTARERYSCAVVDRSG